MSTLDNIDLVVICAFFFAVIFIVIHALVTLVRRLRDEGRQIEDDYRESNEHGRTRQKFVDRIRELSRDEDDRDE